MALEPEIGLRNNAFGPSSEPNSLSKPLVPLRMSYVSRKRWNSNIVILVVQHDVPIPLCALA